MALLVARTEQSGGPGESALFFDDFNYTVAKDSADKEAEFLAGGGYPTMRDSTIDGWQAGVHIWTADAIEGDTDGIPGGGRCLALEALGEDEATQLDYYLSFPVDDWEPDLWIQFWIYVQDDSGSGKQSEIVGARTKFGYPLLGGDSTYGLQTQLTVWILSLTNQVLNTSHSALVTPPSAAHYSFGIQPQAGATGGTPTPRAQIVPRIGSGDENILDPNMVGNDPNDVFFAPNQWRLVKIHVKHNGAVDSNTSEYHMWSRAKGEHVAGFAKYSEYVGGQSNPCGDFNFYNRSFDGNPSGDAGTDSAPITALLFPSTSQGVSGPWGNTYIYMKDYCIAASEDGLPEYGDY